MNTLSLRLPSHTHQYPPESPWAPSAGQKEKLHFSGLALPRAPYPSFHIWALLCLCLWNVLCELCRHKKEDTARFFISGTQRSERWDVGRRETKSKAAREWLSLYETPQGLLQMNPSTEEKTFLGSLVGGFFKEKIKSKSFFLKVKPYGSPEHLEMTQGTGRGYVKARDEPIVPNPQPRQTPSCCLDWGCLPAELLLSACLWSCRFPMVCGQTQLSRMPGAGGKNANAHSRSVVTHRATMA